MPNILLLLLPFLFFNRLSGYIVPPNGELSKFHSIVRPTDPGFSEAPINATDFGWKIVSSGRSLKCFQKSIAMCIGQDINR